MKRSQQNIFAGFKEIPQTRRMSTALPNPQAPSKPIAASAPAAAGGSPTPPASTGAPTAAKSTWWSGIDAWELAGIGFTGAAVSATAAVFTFGTNLEYILAAKHTALPYVTTAMLGLMGSGYVAGGGAAAQRFVQTSLAIGDLRWNRNSFCRGWLISGVTGSGKTEFLKTMMHTLCRHEKGEKDKDGKYKKGKEPWGGLCIDEKSFFKDDVLPILALYGRGEDVYVLETRPEDAPADWKPKFRCNILGDERVSTSQYVDAILRTAATISGGKEDKGFFKTQAGLHIGAAIDLFRGIRAAQKAVGVPRSEWVAPTLRGVYEVLSTQDDYHAVLKKVGMMEEREETVDKPQPGGTVTKETKKKLVITFKTLDNPLLRKTIEHFQKRFWNVKAQEQLEGVKGTITNYLHWFTDDDVCEVFCAVDGDFRFDVMDMGKIICLSMPQRLAIQRRYLCALSKLLAYTHGKSRNPKKYKYNLIIIWQDEAQRFIQEADGDVDIMRQYQMTTVVSTQSKVSLYVPLGGREQAQPLLLNLRNRVILRGSDEECAEESAKFIGKILRKKISKTTGGHSDTQSISEEEQFRYAPYQIRSLPDFTAIVCHSASGHRVYEFAPMDDFGNTPDWYAAIASPGMRRRLPWIKRGLASRYRRVEVPKPHAW